MITTLQTYHRSATSFFHPLRSSIIRVIARQEKSLICSVFCDFSINLSPGGSVQAGLAIFDTMQYIPCDVNTVCFGMAASMGAFLLSAGTKGKRRSLPNSRIMIHQPSGGGQGEVSLCHK